MLVPEYNKPDSPGIHMGFDNTVSIYHIVDEKDSFEKAAQEWKKIAYRESDKKYPRDLNYRFLGDCFESGLKRSIISMDKVVDQYELPFVRQENAQRRREYENSKKR